ncbi:MAG: hypothetical protein AAF438_14560 [Pseudomonadota bacterium]
MYPQPPPYWLTQIYQRLDRIEKTISKMEAMSDLTAKIVKWALPTLVFILLATGHADKANVVVGLIK